MDIQSQIKALEDLAAADVTLVALEADLATERSALGGKQEQLAGLDERLHGAKMSIEQMDRTRQDLMGESRQMSLQLERSREKLGRCRTEREVNAAQREMEELRKLYRDREIEIEKLNGLAEQAQADVVKFTEQRGKLAEAIGVTEGGTRIGELGARARQERGSREELAKALPVPLRRRYERIAKVRGTAIAHITDGICTGCHIALAPMFFQNLRRTASLEQCPACSRIIYYRAPRPEGEEAAEATESSSDQDGAEG